MSATVLALCVGRVASIGGGKRSAIDKRVVEGPVRITTQGLDGDRQGDRRVHGGPHMAVHHYPADHYAFWREELPGLERLAEPGAFGENLHAVGLTEADVYIGDRYRLGGALLEVSMGRQPCATLEGFFGGEPMVRRILANHRCGWYYRVIEEGEAEAGDRLELVERPRSEWSVERAFAVLIDPARAFTDAELDNLLALPALSPQWQAKASAKRR